MDIVFRRERIKCSYCSRSCVNATVLKSHMKQHAPGDSESARKKPPHGSKSHKRGRRKKACSESQKPIDSELRKADFVPQCDRCDKSFRNFEAYEAHMDLFHEGVPEVLVRKEADPDARRRKKRSKRKRGKKQSPKRTPCPECFLIIDSDVMELHLSFFHEKNASQSGSKEPESGSNETNASQSPQLPRKKKHHHGGGASKRGKKRASQSHKKVKEKCPVCLRMVPSACMESHKMMMHEPSSTKEPEASQSDAKDQKLTDVVRCGCCQEPFTSWKLYRDHLVNKFWQPSADKQTDEGKPSEFAVGAIFTLSDTQESDGDDEGSESDEDTEEVSQAEETNEEIVPFFSRNWFRAVYRRNMDELEAEGYNFDTDFDHASYWDRALPPGFHDNYYQNHREENYDWSPEAKRARIKEHNDKLRKEQNLGKEYDSLFEQDLYQVDPWPESSESD